MDKPTYSWSANEETWHGPFGSIDASIQDAFATCAEDVTDVCIGETETIDTGSLFTASQFCELAQERLSDEIGEYGDDFLRGASPEQVAELDAFLRSCVPGWPRWSRASTSALTAGEPTGLPTTA